MSNHLSLVRFSSGMGDRGLNVLKQHEAAIAKKVAENLFERRMKPLLPGQ